MANSEIRKGKVSSVDHETGMVRVTYRDKDESVTADIPALNFNDEYRMPEPGQDVIVAHLSNGSGRAVLLGTVWNKKYIPHETGQDLYRKDFSKRKNAAYMRYDDKKGEWLIKAANVHVNGVNETVLDGPQVEICANISLLIQSDEMQIDTSEVTVTGGEEDKLSAKVQTDVSIDQEKNELEAVILKALVEFVEDLKIQAGMGIEMRAGDGITLAAGEHLDFSGKSARVSGQDMVEIASGDTLRFSDGEHSITLKEIIERLGD